MQAPKRKTSKSVRNQRRSHHALVPKRSAKCPNCEASVLSHHVCMECGYYRGRKIIDVADANA
ncbi:MAG: 50S ribosomal protein L32 [Proteobacteria bacterium]|nr:50S ribosomal protein L32 [Pseudomonadota bacterium]